MICGRRSHTERQLVQVKAEIKSILLVKVQGTNTNGCRHAEMIALNRRMNLSPFSSVMYPFLSSPSSFVESGWWHGRGLSESTHQGRAEQHRDDTEATLRDGLGAHGRVRGGGGGGGAGLGASRGRAGSCGLGGGGGIRLVGVAEDAVVFVALAGQAVA